MKPSNRDESHRISCMERDIRQLCDAVQALDGKINNAIQMMHEKLSFINRQSGKLIDTPLSEAEIECAERYQSCS